MNKYFSTFIAAFIFTVVFFTMINFSSCDETPVDPYDKLKPGRRDYSWEVDTLIIPFTTLWKIWGSSPNNVWAIGPGGDLDKTIYHYDGKKWLSDEISRPISPISIWGFGPDDVWLGGREGRIWHFDGNDWSENLHIKHPIFVNSGFQDIWGESANNIWAVGYLDSAGTRKGIVYHYDGNSWSRINVVYQGNILRIRRGKRTNDNYYLWGVFNNNSFGDSTNILEYNGSKYLKVISTSAYGNGKWRFVQEINDEIIFTIDNSLYTYSNNELELFIENIFPNSYQSIFGRSKKDIFWLMGDGITHYNGNDMNYILKLNTKQRMISCILFENHIFFLAIDFNNGLNIIYRGIVKE